MVEKLSFSDECIIDCLHTHYGINVITLTFLPLGADENAAVYKAETQKSSYFIKLKKDHQPMGPLIQTLLYESGMQQIIYPIKTVHGQLTQKINDFTLIVYPFIEGQDGFSRTLTNDQWSILGKALKQVHEFQLPSHIKKQIKQESYSPQWRNAVRSIYDYLDTEPKIADDVALLLLAFMKEHKEIILHLVNRADQLAQEIQKLSPDIVLCHSDIHAGNILIAKDNTFYIVDWDQPILAPKERDLMFIGGGVGNVWNKMQEEEYFYKGYGATEINKKILSYYRYERIVEDIAIYSQQLLLIKDSGKSNAFPPALKETESFVRINRAVMYQHFIDMFEPREVVDIAFTTDKSL